MANWSGANGYVLVARLHAMPATMTKRTMHTRRSASRYHRVQDGASNCHSTTTRATSSAAADNHECSHESRKR